jgi:hydroxypyruvate isomerase
MPKLAANVSMLFAEVDFLPRFAAAARAGFRAVGHLERLGYGGWIGCEYNPVGDTREGLKWARRYLS